MPVPALSAVLGATKEVPMTKVLVTYASRHGSVADLALAREPLPA